MSTLNTSLITKRRKVISLVPALLVLMLVCLFAVNARAFSSNALDSNRTAGEKAILPDTGKYDLNDPRNPNCPCHNAQKLADDEYRQSQLQQVNKTPVDNNPVNQDSNLNQDTNKDVQHDNPVSNDHPVDRGNPADQVNSNTNSNANKTSYSGGTSVPQGHYSKFYKFSKKMKRWTKKMNRKLKSKNKGVKGGKFRVADCFHWM